MYMGMGVEGEAVQLQPALSFLHKLWGQSSLPQEIVIPAQLEKDGEAESHVLEHNSVPMFLQVLEAQQIEGSRRGRVDAARHWEGEELLVINHIPEATCETALKEEVPADGACCFGVGWDPFLQQRVSSLGAILRQEPSEELNLGGRMEALDKGGQACHGASQVSQLVVPGSREHVLGTAAFEQPQDMTWRDQYYGGNMLITWCYLI
jgi:hypothetical protein